MEHNHRFVLDTSWSTAHLRLYKCECGEYYGKTLGGWTTMSALVKRLPPPPFKRWTKPDNTY